METNLGGSMQFKQGELQKVLKVFYWTVASAVVALLLSLVNIIEVPAQYAFVVPVINTALYAVKEWIADNR